VTDLNMRPPYGTARDRIDDCIGIMHPVDVIVAY
jgi:hypothetical protein